MLVFLITVKPENSSVHSKIFSANKRKSFLIGFILEKEFWVRVLVSKNDKIRDFNS